jgi:hypothetical protein
LNELQAGFRAEEVNKRALDAKSRSLRRLSLLKLIWGLECNNILLRVLSTLVSTAPKQSAGITNDDPLISGLASFTFSASAGGMKTTPTPPLAKFALSSDASNEQIWTAAAGLILR